MAWAVSNPDPATAASKLRKNVLAETFNKFALVAADMVEMDHIAKPRQFSDDRCMQMRIGGDRDAGSHLILTHQTGELVEILRAAQIPIYLAPGDNRGPLIHRLCQRRCPN